MRMAMPAIMQSIRSRGVIPASQQLRYTFEFGHTAHALARSSSALVEIDALLNRLQAERCRHRDGNNEALAPSRRVSGPSGHSPIEPCAIEAF